MPTDHLSDAALALVLGQQLLIHKASHFPGGRRRVEVPWQLGLGPTAPTAAGAIVGPGDHPDVVYELLRSDDQIPALRAHVASLRSYIAANAPKERPAPTVWIFYAGHETDALKNLRAELEPQHVYFLVADV